MAVPQGPPAVDEAPAGHGVEAAEDTVVQARPGDRLVVRNLSGRITVRVRDGDEVHVRLGPSDQGAVGVTRDGSRIVLDDRDRKGRRLARNLALEVPAWLDVDLRGTQLDVSVVGLRSAVSVSSIDGEMEIQDVEGEVTVSTVNGRILVSDVRGAVRAVSVDESIHLRHVVGAVAVVTINGDLILDDVDGMEVDAQTVDGDVEFDGPIHEGGVYTLITHDGEVTAAVPEGVSAVVSVSTFDGSFEAEFPVVLDRFRGGREMSFTLGNGGARIVLQAFDGDIRMRHRR